MTEREFLDRLSRLLTAQIKLYEDMTGRSFGFRIQIVRKESKGS